LVQNSVRYFMDRRPLQRDSPLWVA